MRQPTRSRISAPQRPLQTDLAKPASTPNRRTALVLLTCGSAAAGYFFLYPSLPPARIIAAADAKEQLDAGTLLLIDIRRPDEWQQTGVAKGAIPIDMRADDFVDQLNRAINGDKTRQIGLICARGVRSARLAAKLKHAGFDKIADISEGMLGSAAGPGWIARGFPIIPYKAK
jgi:rhodanese-related sulfurtransferase